MYTMTTRHDAQTGQNEQSVAKSLDKFSPVKVVEKIAAWILTIGATLFALVTILAVWGAFGKTNNTAWKLILSTGIITFAALIIYVSARIYDRNKRAN